ncbi:MAG: hypothetical protein AAFR87_18105 [Bacteroidota bacterium]
MKIYKHPDVQQVQDFYGDLLLNFYESYSVGEHLKLLADRLWEGMQNREEVVAIELSNYHPEYLGQKWNQLSSKQLDKVDAFRCIASQYGFGEWKNVEALDEQDYDPNFEKLVDLVLNGNLSKVKSLLELQPKLINQQSSYGHGASILHYCASNGLELWRQQVPGNLVAISNLLIENGADKQANMKVYGGEFTPLPLLETSAHPLEAGIMEEMKVILT